MNPLLQGMVQQAIQAFQSGNFDGADLILRRVLQADSKNLSALHILGLIKASQSNYKEACDYLARAARIHPHDASLQYNLAKALSDSGNDKDAVAHHKKAVALAPKNPEAWLNYGITSSNLGRYQDALVWHGNALSLNPNYAEAALNKGLVLKKLKRYEEGIAFTKQALLINPNLVEAWSNLGGAFQELKRYDEAIAHYDKALSLNPNLAKAWSNKGVTLNELRRYAEAITHYDKALSLMPDHAEGWSNKGVTLHELKRFDEAIAHYDKALTLKPDYAEGWSKKGVTLHELKRFDEAIAHFDKALSLKPDMDWLSGYLLHIKMKICSWSDLSDSFENISKKILSTKKVSEPFALLALSDDALLHKKSSEIYALNKYPKNPTLGSIPKHAKKEKIRIGYFSADLRQHAVSILAAELFELHNKNRFEIIAFSFGADDKSLMRLRLSGAFNQFIDVSSMSDLDIARLSRELKIDIAVDLGGYTSVCRTGLFAYRAAPIQVSYLGYLGTMGTEYIDYILADKTTIPDGSEPYYSEKIVYLPSYQVNDRRRVISDKIFTRRELGLPEKGFVFCCFNNNYKILPNTFASWMRILKAVEDSILFLYADNKWVEVNLKKEAEARGINSARLVFGSSIHADEYLARYRACDLFLDTAPYNAGTTASDALWAGVPILTVIGQSFASRMAASLLKAIELPELITSTQEEYEALAIDLAKNPQKLADIKLKLANNRLSTPLFDTPLFTKNLEAAYIKIYERYQDDLQPDHITIV
jgi:protein O-GlcNAc transferase